MEKRSFTSYVEQSKKILAFRLLPKPHSIKIYTKQKELELSRQMKRQKYLRCLRQTWPLLYTITIISAKQLLSCRQTLDGTSEFSSSHRELHSAYLTDGVWDVNVRYFWWQKEKLYFCKGVLFGAESVIFNL